MTAAESFATAVFITGLLVLPPLLIYLVICLAKLLYELTKDWRAGR